MDNRYRLVALSSLMLFVELTLIRWVGANVYYLFFFANFILLASFLGIGIGFLRSHKANDWYRYTPILLAFIVLFSYLNGYEYHAVLNPQTDNLDYSGTIFMRHLYPVWITLPLVFASVVFLMAGIASAVAKVFRQYPPLIAYRLEISGSLLGIVAFSLLSFFHQGPVAWGAVIVLLYSPLLWQELQKKHYAVLTLQIAMLITMMATFINETSSFQHYWSSYYKIEVQEYAGKRYVVNVNGLAQQVIESVTQRQRVKPFYFVPYKQLQKNHALDNVLVIGAGTGRDVAIALAQGAKNVDAVEIDPMLYKLGRKFNPDHPYADPRVHMYIDDGRAFLQRTQNKYDMIIFALTDSLSLIPGQSSLRLENYLYTIEGMKAASIHLKDNGVFTLYNYYSLPWLIDRLANTLAQVYSHAPCLARYSPQDYSATVFTISKAENALNCESLWEPNGASYENPITDDHPFMYLQENTLPPLYIFTLTLMLLATFGSLKFMGISYRSIKNYLPLFLMGSAFLLLETKNIINFALYFGTTWFVNALVFIGILFTVYLSIEIRRLIQISRVWIFTGLLLSLVVALIMPNESVLAMPFILRFFVTTLVAFVPILFANILFADQFQESVNNTEAFGWNLLGAVVGGVLEYASMLIGYQHLMILVIGLYVMTMVLIVKKQVWSQVST